MSLKNKIAAAAMLAMFVLPVVSFAQTTDVASLEAEIQALQAQLANLQAQLAAQQGSSSVNSDFSALTCYTFTHDLYNGSTQVDGKILQHFLIKDGETITQTGIYDSQTADAVKIFQEKYYSYILTPNGLARGTGHFGPSTRAFMNRLFSCNSNGATPTPIPSPPPSLQAPTPISGPFSKSGPPLSISDLAYRNMDSNSKPPSSIVPGSSGVIDIISFTNNGATDALIKSVTITDKATAGSRAGFTSLGLDYNDTEIGIANPAAINIPGYAGYQYVINFANEVIVPAGHTVNLTVRGYMDSYVGEVPFTDGSVHNLSVAAALGTFTTSADMIDTGVAVTQLRSMVYVTGKSVAAFPPATMTKLGTLTIRPVGGDVQLSNIVLYLCSLSTNCSGFGANWPSFGSTIHLKDDSTGVDLGTLNNVTVTPTASQVNITFSTTTPYIVPFGDTFSLDVYGDLSLMAGSSPISLIIVGQGDYRDGTDRAAISFPFGSGGNDINNPLKVVDIFGTLLREAPLFYSQHHPYVSRSELISPH